MKTFLTVCAVLTYAIMNLAMARLYSAKQMRKIIIDGQCFVGMIAANIFYAPAWILKALRMIVIATIR